MNYHLIADDNDLNRMVIKILLERNGYKCEESENGKEVIEKIKANPDKYSFVWMDLDMPIINGIECSLILKNKMNYDGHIIGITGHIDKESMTTSKKAGMVNVLAKPIFEETLIENINFYSEKDSLNKKK